MMRWHDARCPSCHKALLLRWQESTRSSPRQETSCRSCKALVTFELIPTSSRPVIHDIQTRSDRCVSR